LFVCLFVCLIIIIIFVFPSSRISWNAPAHAVVRHAELLTDLYDLSTELGRG
jgi:hypothetical protein